MSGIVGIVNLDGAPVDLHLLRRMTDSLAFRGPDRQDVWSDGAVGFGHTMLATTFEAEREKQPCTLDRQVWITADARVDARCELKRELEEAGRQELQDATDADLILHAYHAWGEDCVQHLLGDFAFAVWDKPRRRLFCARDHFGVRPFYYAHLGNTLVFSNTLDCVRLHPGVSSTLNELAVADFLLFGYNQELDTTTFASVQSLAPAHWLAFGVEPLTTRRYWTLRGEALRFRNAAECCERFKELLQVAVTDRLRVGHAAVLMTGGLDSTSVAAVAGRQLPGPDGLPAVRTYTCGYDRLIPDDEWNWASLVAERLGVAATRVPADGYALFDRWDDGAYLPPEPVDYPFWALTVDVLRQASARDRVVLTGEGGDAAFAPTSRAWDMLRHGRVRYLGGQALAYWRSRRRLPGFGLRTWLREMTGGTHSRAPCPPWLDRAFARRLRAEERIRDVDRRTRTRTAREYLRSASWPWCLHFRDAGWTRTCTEARHPYFDTRLLSLLLSVPSVEWSREKQLVRTAMRGWLPDAVCERPKAPLAGEPAHVLLQRLPVQAIMRAAAPAATWGFVDETGFRRSLESGGGQADRDGVVRVLALSRWLERAAQAS